VIELAARAKDGEALTVTQALDPDAYGIEMMDYLP